MKTSPVPPVFRTSGRFSRSWRSCGPASSTSRSDLLALVRANRDLPVRTSGLRLRRSAIRGRVDRQVEYLGLRRPNAHRWPRISGSSSAPRGARGRSLHRRTTDREVEGCHPPRSKWGKRRKNRVVRRRSGTRNTDTYRAHGSSRSHDSPGVTAPGPWVGDSPCHAGTAVCRTLGTIRMPGTSSDALHTPRKSSIGQLCRPSIANRTAPFGSLGAADPGGGITHKSGGPEGPPLPVRC